jgi:alkylation response protein AidB-like acyl-CoA dehydrogenase
MTAAGRTADLGAWRDLVLSGDRAEFAASVRRHLSDRFPLSMVRAAFDQPPDAGAGWDEIARSGYPLVGLPESAGGAGSLVDLVALLEEAGRGLLSVPLLSTVLGLQTLIAAGAPLGADADPAESPAGFGIAATGEVTGQAITARAVGVLDGRPNRPAIIVLPDGADVVAAELGPACGAKFDGAAQLDPGRAIAVADLDRATARSVHRVRADLDGLLGPARVAVAADLTGVAAGALDRSVQHALDRMQFGRRLGAFQAVKHTLANLYLAVEGARSLTRAAAITLAGGPGDPAEARVLPLLAKAAAAEAALRATAVYVQLLGAMGVTFEADAHLYFRRAQQTAPFLGSAADCYQRAVRIAGGIR